MIRGQSPVLKSVSIIIEFYCDVNMICCRRGVFVVIYVPISAKRATLVCKRNEFINQLILWWGCKQFSWFRHIEYLHVEKGEGAFYFIRLQCKLLHTWFRIFPKIDFSVGERDFALTSIFVQKIWDSQYVANSVKCVTNFLPFQANVISGTIIYHLTLRFCSKS